MPDESLHVVPTELERSDAFMDAAVLAGTVLVAWYFWLQGLPWLIVPFLPFIAFETLTGESVAEVPFLGAIAAGLRSMLGLRRANEWARAYAHYVRVTHWRSASAWWRSSPSKPVHAEPLQRRTAEGCRAALEVWPTSNYRLASDTERADQMDMLARVLMGLSYPVQLVGQSHETTLYADWPRPPRIARRWLVVIVAPDETALEWRINTMRDALEGSGLRTADFLDVVELPRVMVQSPDAVTIAGEWVASMVLRRWPREVSPGWLGQALANAALDVAIHFQPQDAQRIARFLKRQQTWQTDANAVRPDAGNTLGRMDAERVRMKLIARTDRPCKVAIVFTVKAPDAETLRQRVETLGHEVGLTLGDARLATFEQDRAVDATRAFGRCDLLGAWRTLDCTSVASTWLFQPGTVHHEHGADLGTTHDGSMLVRLDPFDQSLESFGGIVLAKVGAGKSYFLKLLAKRLEGVEVLIVEQRTPAEYHGVPGARTFNLADVPYADRAGYLRDFVSELWETAKRDPRPRLLILDELWSLLRDPALATLIEEIARIGRHHYLSLWIATQQVSELLNSDGGKAVLDNAAIRVYLRQHDRDLEHLCDAVGLASPTRRFLRSAVRGQAVLDVSGMIVPVDIQASPTEHQRITTDPREKAARIDNAANTRQDDIDGLGDTASEDGTSGGGSARVRLDSAGCDRSGRATIPVAAE